jgi:hypothetical protein
MKKFLLLLVAVVLAGGLVLSCSQPSSYEVTLTPGSAPSVEGEKIVAEQLVNSILVKWDAAQDSAGYYVYRKEVGADGPIDATLVIGNSGAIITTLSPKGVPYYLDTGVKDGVTYQYGIASQSYKDSGDVVVRSEVVWQAETDTSKFAKAAIIAKGLVKLPATPTYTASKIDTTPPQTGETNYVESTYLTFSGLLPGYEYTWTPEFANIANPTAGDWNATGGSLTYTWDIGNYVDDGSVLYSEITDTGASNTSTASAYVNYAFRVRVDIGLNTTDTGFYDSSYAIEIPSAFLIPTGSPGVSVVP